MKLFLFILSYFCVAFQSGMLYWAITNKLGPITIGIVFAGLIYCTSILWKHDDN